VPTRGTVCAGPPGPRRIELREGELEYLRTHWKLIKRLTETLRTERNVRMAVLFGSVARGDETADSDLDVLVELRDSSLAATGRLRRRLRDAAGRDAQLVTVEAASSSPLLMADVVEDGRVLVDRMSAWPAWRERESRLRAAANRKQTDAEARAREVFAHYGRVSR
jgi:predicted nucleotidyltransferase